MNELITGGSSLWEKLRSYLLSPGFWVSLIVIGAAFLLWRFIRSLLRRQAEKTGKRNEGAARLIKYVLLLMTVLAVFQFNGINVSSLVASLGVLTAVVGFALQDLLKDIIMGFHITSDRFFQTGDVVRYHDTEGIVESFTIRTTKIRSLIDNSLTCVCNRNIEEIRQESGTLLLDVPLSYEDDFHVIHATLQRCAERIRRLENVKGCRYLGTQDFNDSSISYRLLIETNPVSKYPVRRACLSVLQEELAHDGLEIPFNQLDIHQK